VDISLVTNGDRNSKRAASVWVASGTA